MVRMSHAARPLPKCFPQPRPRLLARSRPAHRMPQCRPTPPAPRWRPAPQRRRGGQPKPPCVREWIVLRYRQTGASPRELEREFNRVHAGRGLRVTHNTIRKWIAGHVGRAERVRAASRNRIPRHSPANLRWALDCTGKADASGTVHCVILGIIDHGSRFAPVLVRLQSQDAEAILAHVREAVTRHGKPRFLRTDNAPVFHSAAFEAGLAAMGIRHEFSQPGCPWQNGRIERLFLTLKQQLNQVIPRDGAALDSLLAEFATWYNEIRPHQHLHGFTPAEVWRGIDPYETAPKAIQMFEAWDGMLKGIRLIR